MKTNFSIPNRDGSIIKIKKTSDIINAIKYATEASANQTARRKLDNFKLLMHGMPSRPPVNYYLAYSCMECLDLPEDLFPVCCKMSCYMKSSGYIYSSNTVLSSQHGENYIGYNYNIPLLFMPIFIAFLLAFQEKRGKKPIIHSFFHCIDKYLNRYSLDDIIEQYPSYTKENLSAMYDQWMRDELGRDYFIHLEELYTDLASSEYERKCLKEATCQLTDLMLFPRTYCTASAADLDLLLLDYRELLEKKAAEGNSKKPNYHCLFQERYPFPIEEELKFIEQIYNRYTCVLRHLDSRFREYFEQHHKPVSPYVLAVKDIDNFNEFIENEQLLIENVQDEIADGILSYYLGLQFRVDISKFLEEGALELHKENNNYKIRRLLEIVVGSLSDIIDEMEKLLKIVRRASGDDPLRYNAKTVESFKSIQFLDELSRSKKKVFSSLKDNNFSVNYPAFLCRKTSYAYEMGFVGGNLKLKIKRYFEKSDNFD